MSWNIHPKTRSDPLNILRSFKIIIYTRPSEECIYFFVDRNYASLYEFSPYIFIISRDL